MSETTGSTETIAELKALVADLAGRVQTLEEEAAQRHPAVSEDVVLAISAAVAAYLGKRATVKQVHLRRGGSWATQGLATVQQSHADRHGVRDRQTVPTLHARRGMT